MSVKAAVKPPRAVVGLLRRRRVPRTVGIVHPSYGYERVAYGLPVSGYEFCRLRSLPLHRLESKGTFLQYTPVLLDNSACLVHTWNAIPIHRAPFVISFENELPRYLIRSRPWQDRMAHALLESRRCRALLGLSDIAAALARQRFVAAGLEEVARKVDVFRGGVAALEADVPDARRPRSPGEALRAIFVGTANAAKGLLPVIAALESLRKGGVDVRLTVVGGVLSRDSILRGRTPTSESILRRLGEADWITYHSKLPNVELRKLMGEHSVLLMPSLDESLGWAVVEAGLAGIPAVTTNVFALPELVIDAETGFVLDLELGKQSRWVGVWATDRELDEHLDRAYEVIEGGVASAVEKLARSPELARSLGDAALRRMSRLYDPGRAAQRLAQIYDRALAD